MPSAGARRYSVVLVERTTQEGVVVLGSRLLLEAGFLHAFSTRLGGVSPAPLGPLNLQSPRANRLAAEGAPRDDEANLAENLRRFKGAAGLDPDEPTADARQVHGPRTVRSLDALAATLEADAIVSPPGGSAVLVRIADCVPILIGCRATGAVAAIHAGWRGVVAGVVASAVDAMRGLGAEPSSMLAAIGPSISHDAFEIGPEVAALFEERALGGFVSPPDGDACRHHADLAAATASQLEAAGVRAIDASPPCTHGDPRRFHSHRRDGAASGRLAAVIRPRS